MQVNKSREMSTTRNYSNDKGKASPVYTLA